MGAQCSDLRWDPQSRAKLNLDPVQSTTDSKRTGFHPGNFIRENAGHALKDVYDVDVNDLGEGGTSKVYGCTHQSTRQRRAVKIVKLELLRDTASVFREIELMKWMDHPNVVRLVESFEDTLRVSLVLELCDGGSLFDHIVDFAPVPERTAAFCLRQMLRAVTYLHERCVIHRDLKAENWLFASDAKIPEKTVLKLTDFGIARNLAVDEVAHTRVGTPYYVAPEVIEGSYNSKADVWTTGIVLFMLLDGRPPFAGNNTGEVLKKVKTGRWRLPKEAAPDPAHSLLRAMLNPDPALRSSAKESSAHPWLPTSLTKLDNKEVAQAAEETRSHIARFKTTTLLERAALSIAALHADHEHLLGMETLFLQMDTSGNGCLSETEFREGLLRWGIELSRAEVAAVIKTCDSDGSGDLAYSEFLSIMMDRERCSSEEVCRRAFQVFDVYNNGYIDRAKVTSLLCSGLKRNRRASREDEHLLDGRDVGHFSVAHFSKRSLSKEPLPDVGFDALPRQEDGMIGFTEFMAMLTRLK